MSCLLCSWQQTRCMKIWKEFPLLHTHWRRLSTEATYLCVFGVQYIRVYPQWNSTLQLQGSHCCKKICSSVDRMSSAFISLRLLQQRHLRIRLWGTCIESMDVAWANLDNRPDKLKQQSSSCNQGHVPRYIWIWDPTTLSTLWLQDSTSNMTSRIDLICICKVIFYRIWVIWQRGIFWF